VILGILTTLTTACERKVTQLRGTVTSSETGFPLSGVAVRLGNAQTTTDSSGEYAVSAGRPGSQKLYAWLSGYEPYSTEITVGSSSAEWDLVLLPQPVVDAEASAQSEVRPSGQQTGTSTKVVPPAQPTVPSVSEVRQGRMDARAPTGMALIPAGSFQMGDALNEGFPDERPTRTVHVSAFYMDAYEVTKALWDEVASWAVAHGYDIGPVDGDGKAAEHPVCDVSWYEAVKWANARSEKEKLTPCYTVNGSVYRLTGVGTVDCNWNVGGYRLPTEAEWEKAARGGAAGRRYPWTDTDAIDTSRARYNEPYGGPISVGSYAPNGLGLYDTAGNAWEWCWDWYDESTYTSSGGSDPHGPESGWDRVARGGGWGSVANLCRVANRGNYWPSIEYSLLGFRLVRTAP
jgi:formylglycine-generating enzyme required for sulfatase activity